MEEGDPNVDPREEVGGASLVLKPGAKFWFAWVLLAIILGGYVVVALVAFVLGPSTRGAPESAVVVAILTVAIVYSAAQLRKERVLRADYEGMRMYRDNKLVREVPWSAIAMISSGLRFPPPYQYYYLTVKTSKPWQAISTDSSGYAVSIKDLSRFAEAVSKLSAEHSVPTSHTDGLSWLSGPHAFKAIAGMAIVSFTFLAVGILLLFQNGLELSPIILLLIGSAALYRSMQMLTQGRKGRSGEHP